MSSAVIKITPPAMDRTLRVPKTSYTCRLTEDKFDQDAYDAQCSTGLVYAPKKTSEQMIEMLPDGHRLSALEEIKWLEQRKTELEAEGKSPREALQDVIFDYFFKHNGKPYKWQRTGVILKPADGAEMLGTYTDTDTDGRKYMRVDAYYVGRDSEGKYSERKFAEGLRLPNTKRSWQIVTEVNPATGIPSAVAEARQKVPNHTIHLWTNPDLPESAVDLSGGWYGDERDRCLAFSADWLPSGSNDDAAFRLFQGSFSDVTLHRQEIFVKDMESYEKGLARGKKEGYESGVEEGKREGGSAVIRDFLQLVSERPIEEVLKTYREQL